MYASYFFACAMIDACVLLMLDVSHFRLPSFISFRSIDKSLLLEDAVGIGEGIYTIVGNLCETDTFAWDRKLHEVREGDYMVFYNAGAYGFEMSSNFNAISFDSFAS